MSLLEILRKNTKFSLFTTPSHSQKRFLLPKFRQFYKYDISETDIHNPQKALELAQKNAAKIYKTKSTYFLTNGSTSGVIASVLACVKPNENVLIWDNAHTSHLNSVKLAGATPVFYEIKKDKDWDIYLNTEPETIEKILKESQIKAVIITSPSYEGIISDIKKIKAVCKKYNAFLIVDEAHGALYPFCDKLPTSAIYSEADFIIQSLHKTAGGLNPTAVLHCNIEADVQNSLVLISTTSPSYPLLASIEKNINYINSKKGQKEIEELLKNIEKLKNNVKNCEFYTNNDPTKILVKHKNLSGEDLSDFLYKNKIEDEKTNKKSTMLICGIGTDFKKLKRLEKILKKLD